MRTRTRSAAIVLTIVIVLVTCACSPVAPSASEVIGTWEKQDTALPPINLMLSADGGVTRARLRLSGVELNGTAAVDGDRLELSFPDRPPITGRFTSKTELIVRLGEGNSEFTLQRQGP